MKIESRYRDYKQRAACSSLPLLFSLFLAAFALVPHAEAFHARLTPAAVRPGDAFVLKVTGMKQPALPSAVLNSGTLRFSRCGKGCFLAIGAVDLDTKPGAYRVLLKIGKKTASRRLRVLRAAFKTTHITLPEEKASPGIGDIERINREAHLLHSIWQIDSEKLWDGNFMLPLGNALSTPFGTKRIINNETVSIHRGLDMQGQEGEPIYAANRGRVVLTEELFFGGDTLILDHGQGIFSIYMHLSGFTVSPGDIVAKEDVIGFVGSSGRSSGPHLHFGVKVGNISVNPLSVAGLPL